MSGVTPKRLSEARIADQRTKQLEKQGDFFWVHEVVECASSDDSDVGEEDLPVDDRTSAVRRREHALQEQQLARRRKEAEDRGESVSGDRERTCVGDSGARRQTPNGASIPGVD